MCEGAIEKVREKERARERERERDCGSKKRSGPTGVCKETSQALIGNLVDCQLQTNRKKRSERRDELLYKPLERQSPDTNRRESRNF